MKHVLLASAGLSLLCSLPQNSHAQELKAEPALLDVVIVTGRQVATEVETSLRPDSLPLNGADISRLTARTPGAARIANGQLSGQVMYRGLAGKRLNLRVDGQRFASAGPNLMDPVFHFAPSALVQSVVIDRGISPVSEGPGLGGGANAVFKKVDFSDSADMALGYDLTAGARSSDESAMAGGIVGASSATLRFNILGVSETGNDTQFKGGVVGGSAFKRDVFGVSAGARLGRTDIGLDVRRQNTGPSGNAPFPMDIRFVDGDFAKLSVKASWGGSDVNAFVSYADVTHAMNNFGERPAPMAMMFRENLAQAETHAVGVSVKRSFENGVLNFGVDGDERSHDARITNPNMEAFFVRSLPNVEMRRIGAFGQWTGAAGPVQGELGVRLDQYDADSGEAELAAMLPMGAQMIAMAFNGAEHSWDASTYDVAARLWSAPRNGVSWRGTLARKTHVASPLQRFAWLPLQASGGLADGNTYVGDVNLDPEVALIAEAGFDYVTDAAYLRPTIYVRHVTDYIQGVPFDDTPGVIDTPWEMVSAMNGGDSLLQFANVDARLYGLDVDAGWDFGGPVRIDGVLSYVEGHRRDIDDALYRLSPLRGQATATWEAKEWSAAIEAVGVAKQSRVSVTNNEQKTPGYVTLNLYGNWTIAEGVGLSLGIENFLDHDTRDHLAGYNRNAGSDVGVGERLPGEGRGAFLRVNVKG